MATRKPEVVGSGGEFQFNVNPRAVIIAMIVVLLALWFVRGGPAYTVGPDEEGVVLRFGKYHRSTQPGFHFKLPWPVESVETPKITEVKRIEIGFRAIGDGQATKYVSFMDSDLYLREAQMLTGDENVVDCSMVIQYQIRSAEVRDYLYNFESSNAIEETLRDIGEASLRQAVGDHPIDDVLTTGKDEVQLEIEEKAQELADLYRMGIKIIALKLQDVQPPEEVADAFKDVATAREEKQMLMNEAEAYRSEEIPKAKGEAEAMRLDAEGYREARIEEAHGAVARFVAMANEYKLAPEVTQARMYLEMINKLLPNVRLTVIDEDAGIVNLKSLTGGAMPPPQPAKRKAGSAVSGPQPAQRTTGGTVSRSQPAQRKTGGTASRSQPAKRREGGRP